MSAARMAPFGTWKSPIDSRMVAGAGRSSRGIFSELQADQGQIFWRQLLAEQDGRYSIFTIQDGQAVDLLPPGLSARSRVHEYGGGSYTIHDGVLFISNDSDQRLYRLNQGSEPEPITPRPDAPRSQRYADFRAAPDGNKLVSVRERHLAGAEVVNELVMLDTSGGSEPWVIEGGRDFYSNPRWSPDGSRIMWLCWDHPNMPWDECELWIAPVEGDALGRAELLSGGSGISIFQPCWGPDGGLFYVTDRSGWWNLAGRADGQGEHLHDLQAELGSPHWSFGLSHLAFLDPNRIAAIAISHGIDRLVIIDSAAGLVEQVKLPFTAFNPACLRSDGAQRLWFVASSPDTRQALYSYDTRDKHLERLTSGPGPEIEDGYISRPESISFPTAGGEIAHAIYYPPQNKDFRAPADTNPPLIVSVHGGPTSAAKMQYHLETQFFTSRGFAFVDVNYRGSTGYGRPYRDALKGMWGVADMQDCLAAARYLAESGRIHPGQQAIRGSSAGGFTTLRALQEADVFDAGASYYGVADLAGLAEHTHKFEKHYLDSLVGPYPQAIDLYRERSPVLHADQLSSPLILLQGSEDKVVPPDQAYQMAAALEARGIPYSLILIEGESHGFYAEESVIRALDAELAFYKAVFDILPDDADPTIEIHNLN